jgi:Na+-transporting NADH:ubiquinone oxidoreductase subunit NqrC
MDNIQSTKSNLFVYIGLATVIIIIVSSLYMLNNNIKKSNEKIKKSNEKIKILEEGLIKLGVSTTEVNTEFVNAINSNDLVKANNILQGLNLDQIIYIGDLQTNKDGIVKIYVTKEKEGFSIFLNRYFPSKNYVSDNDKMLNETNMNQFFILYTTIFDR